MTKQESFSSNNYNKLCTTLSDIKSKSPCVKGWELLLRNSTEFKKDDPMSLMHIFKSNGIKDAVWALRCFDHKDYCLFLADVAESVLHIYERRFNSKAPREAIEAIRLYKTGEIGAKDLEVAADAAYVAYGDTCTTANAAYAANAAAYAAAYAADAAAAAAYAAYAASDAANAAYVAYAANAAAYAADATHAARLEKWAEIERLFSQHFGGQND